MIVAYTHVSQAFGSFTKTSIAWADAATKHIVVNASVRVYTETEMAIFAQVWPSGWTAPAVPPPPPGTNLAFSKRQ